MIRKDYIEIKQIIKLQISAGIADYFDIDLVISRLIFLLSFLVGGLILYLINWIIILVKDTSN